MEIQNMSISLYYQARRTCKISLQEEMIYNKIINRYNVQYPFGELYEAFCVYDFSEEEFYKNNIIFNGSVKLSMDWGEELFGKILCYWLDCLNEITDSLHNASWYASLDDFSLILDENGHWNFSIDYE